MKIRIRMDKHSDRPGYRVVPAVGDTLLQGSTRLRVVSREFETISDPINELLWINAVELEVEEVVL